MLTKFTTLPLCLIVCTLLASSAYGQSEWVNGMHGKWQCDVEKTLEAMAEAEMPEPQVAMLKEMLPGITMAFTADGDMMMNMEMGGMKQERKATYTVSETDEEKKLIKITVKMEETPDEEKTGELTMLGEDSMKLVTDDGSIMIFKRIKKKEGSDSKDG